MIIVKPSFEILTPISNGGLSELKFIERIGRTCYKSEDRISEDGVSSKKFVKMLIDRGHEAMIEHSTLSVLFVVDRGVSHELTRHRLCSFAQESTRYCNYSNAKFDSQITVIEPPWRTKEWEMCCSEAEERYFNLLKSGMTPQMARCVLPNSLKTEIIMTANYREWRSILRLRTAPDAHPQMREVMTPLLKELKTRIPVVFDDIEIKEKSND